MNAMDTVISEETKSLVEEYLDAASNLYGIAPLSKILSIYNSQNEPLSEDDFLSIVDNIMKKHKFFSIVAEDEFYDDVEKTKPIDRDLVAEYVLTVDDDDYYYLKGEQYGKPYYVPDKAQFLKYKDEYYHEKTLSFISLRAFLRNRSGLSKEDADYLAEDLYGMADVYEGDVGEAVNYIQQRTKDHFPENDVKAFIPLFIDMFNDTRLQVNRGFTANEIKAF